MTEPRPELEAGRARGAPATTPACALVVGVLGAVLAVACSGAGSDAAPGTTGATGGSAGGGTGGEGAGGAGGGVGPACAPLAAASGTILSVTPADVGNLQTIVAGAQPGDTIALADGSYPLGGQYLWIGSPGVTLRSASGNRDAVVLDADYQTTEIVTIAASNVTVAELTLARAGTHAIHVVTSGADTTGTRIHGVHVVDPREQGIKVNPSGDGFYVDDGILACSLLELTDAGRPEVQPNPGGCYTGGIDAHAARGWVVRDNRITGFWCDTGLSEHAIHFWRGSRDTLVERNVLVDDARGVGFGLETSGTARTYADAPCPAAQGAYVDHYGGVVRNNFVAAGSAGLLASPTGFDCGICLWSACGAEVVHNSVASTGANFSSIEWRFAGSVGVDVTNNLGTHDLRERDGASATQAGNLSPAPLALFVWPAGGDLHLAPSASAAIDQGVAVVPGLCDEDIDGAARAGTRDLGADERP